MSPRASTARPSLLVPGAVRHVVKALSSFRRERRRTWLALASALVALVATERTQAATITLDAVTCPLDVAVLAMNSAQDQAGCAAVGAYGENDTITIPSGRFYINSPITISKSLSIIGSGACSTHLRTSSPALAYAIRVVGAGNTVTIQDVDLVGKKGNSTTGIYVEGTGDPDDEEVRVSVAGSKIHGFHLSGIVITAGGNVDVVSSLIYRNSNPEAGGAVSNRGSSSASARFSAENTWFGFNSAARGGAVYNHAGVAQLMTVAFESNHATVTGGAIYGVLDAFYRVYLNTENESVFLNNTADNGGYSIVDGDMVSEFTPATACGNSAPYCNPAQVPEGSSCPQQ